MERITYKTALVGIITLGILLPAYVGITFPPRHGTDTGIHVSKVEAKGGSTKRGGTKKSSSGSKKKSSSSKKSSSKDLPKVSSIKKISGNRYKVKVDGKTVYVRDSKGISHAKLKAAKAVKKGLPASSCRNVTTNMSRDWGNPPRIVVDPPPYRPPTVPPDISTGGTPGGGGSTRTTGEDVPASIITGYYDDEGDFIPVDPVDILDFAIGATLTNNQCTLYWDSNNATYCALLKGIDGTSDEIEVPTSSGDEGFQVSPGTYRLYCEHELTGDSIVTEPVTCRLNLDFREI